jgi:hypothetical protein
MNTFELFEKWAGDRNEGFAPAFALGRMTADTMESIARRNFDVASDCFDFGLSHVKALTAGDLAHLGAEEMRLATDLGEKLKTHADAYVRIAMDAGQAWAEWTTTLGETVKPVVTPKADVKPAKKR